MLIGRLITSAVNAFIPGSSDNVVLSPKVSITALTACAAAIMITPWPYITLWPAALVIASFPLRRGKRLVNALTASSPFILTYVTLALAMQLITNSLSLHYIAFNSLRLLSLIMTSAVIASFTRVYDLVRLISKISPNLALLIALSIRYSYVTMLRLNDLTSIYSVNLPGGGFRQLIVKVKAITSSIAYSCVELALDSSEALQSSGIRVIAEGK